MVIKIFELYMQPLFFLLAAIPAWLVNIDEEMQRKIVEQTEKRYHGEPAHDPLTGADLPTLPTEAEREQLNSLMHFEEFELALFEKRGFRSVLLLFCGRMLFWALLMAATVSYIVSTAGTASFETVLSVGAILATVFFSMVVWELLRIRSLFAHSSELEEYRETVMFMLSFYMDESAEPDMPADVNRIVTGANVFKFMKTLKERVSGLTPTQMDMVSDFSKSASKVRKISTISDYGERLQQGTRTRLSRADVDPVELSAEEREKQVLLKVTKAMNSASVLVSKGAGTPAARKWSTLNMSKGSVLAGARSHALGMHTMTSKRLPTAATLPEPGTTPQSLAAVTLPAPSHGLSKPLCQRTTVEKKIMQHCPNCDGRRNSREVRMDGNEGEAARLAKFEQKVRMLEKKLGIPYEIALELVMVRAEKGTVALSKAPFRQNAHLERLQRGTSNCSSIDEEKSERSMKERSQPAARDAMKPAASGSTALTAASSGGSPLSPRSRDAILLAQRVAKGAANSAAVHTAVPVGVAGTAAGVAGAAAQGAELWQHSASCVSQDRVHRMEGVAMGAAHLASHAIAELASEVCHGVESAECAAKRMSHAAVDLTCDLANKAAHGVESVQRASHRTIAPQYSA